MSLRCTWQCSLLLKALLLWALLGWLVQRRMHRYLQSTSFAFGREEQWQPTFQCRSMLAGLGFGFLQTARERLQEFGVVCRGMGGVTMPVRARGSEQAGKQVASTAPVPAPVDHILFGSELCQRVRQDGEHGGKCTRMCSCLLCRAVVYVHLSVQHRRHPKSPEVCKEESLPPWLQWPERGKVGCWP